MDVSILIVSKNRKQDLEKTLSIIEKCIDKKCHEIRVFLDGCTDGSEVLKNIFPWIHWEVVKETIGASIARNILYNKAVGSIFIGFDDDAHPLNTDFIQRVLKIFIKNPNIGIIAFEEVKGVFDTDESAIKSGTSNSVEFLTNEFIGCGFAIKKDVYEKTNGFPVWMDIYGEESCVSIEVLDKGYDIIYSNQIKVNHRVNIIERKKRGLNYFRFGKQLKNTTYYYLVYYPFPLIRILKLYWHNFNKYALHDIKCFVIFFKVICEVFIKMPAVLRYRNPVKKDSLKKKKNLSPIKY